MGQSIEVTSQVMDDVVIFDTDRAITGQDGVSYSSTQEIAATDFPAQLAKRLFADVSGIDHVFVASNQVVVRRPHGWDDDVVETAKQVIARFFRFYD